MISSKEEYKYYLYCDKIALGKEYKKPRFFKDEIWKFEILMRKAEYFVNCSNNFITKLYSKFLKLLYHKKCLKLGFSIPLNVFGPGLSIAHYGTIVVNGNSRVGKNCRIQECTTIGATSGFSSSPQIGDNVFIGSGAKIIGNITIANDIAIGANALVNKSFEESGITIAGVPAKKISNNNSHSNLNQLLKTNKLL